MITIELDDKSLRSFVGQASGPFFSEAFSYNLAHHIESYRDFVVDCFLSGAVLLDKFRTVFGEMLPQCGFIKLGILVGIFIGRKEDVIGLDTLGDFVALLIGLEVF